MARMDSIDNYQVLNLVGKGGFASVYKAKRVSTGQEVAIKMVDKQQMMASGMAERVKQEVEIHSRLNHPAILEVLGYFEDNSHVYMVLELCENGELAKYLRDSNRVFSEQEARTIFEQVVSGLLYLHGHGIMHRDLTLANLLLTRDMRVKIADFGLATRLTGRPNERHVTMCGTPNYISPEVATRSSHGLEADVWGLGCLLYTMLVGKPPFDTAGVRSTLTRVVMADFLLPPHLTPEAQDLLSQLLRKNPSERLRLKELAGHPWMARPQDSGMFTMTTTAFSSVSGQRAPGPRPLPAYPALTEYSAEMASQHSAPRSTTPYSAPHLLHPSSPPVKMVTPAQDLPAPLLPHYRGAPPQTSLYSRQFSLPDTGARAPMAALPPREVSMRSVHSDPSLHHQQRPTEFLQQPAPPPPPSQPPPTGGPGVPPLSSTRLRPTRQKTKNAVANISPSGEVCLEFLKVRQGEERVVDVMRISGDGQRVVVYTPGPSKAEGAPVLASPAPIPSRGADAFYSYQSLPDKYWKKYQYAERFVNLVKAKTPKMTLYTAQAKCYLMENSERDFEVFFYSGLKATLSGAGAGRAVKLIGGAGGSQTFGWPVRPESLAMDTRRNMEHFTSCLAHCTRLEAVLGTLDSAEQPVFPLVLGRKPQLLQGGDNSLEKENREPQVGGGMRDTLLSGHQRAPSVLGRPPASQRSLPSPGRDGHNRKVAIEGVGEAVQLACGNVRVYYLDGSSLILRSATATVDYFLPSPGGGGAWCTYTSSDMPEGVRAKMGGIPRVLQCLLGEQGGRPASVR